MIYPLAALALLWFLATRTPLLARVRAMARRTPFAGTPLAGKLGSVFILVAALAAVLHGNAWAALCLFGLSLWLLGRAQAPSTRTRDASGSPWSRSATLEMSVDRRTGRLRGGVIAGPFAGAVLDNLALPQLAALRQSCVVADPAGVRLLDVYLDGRFPGWRVAGDADREARQADPRRAGGMTEDEAYQVLGLRRGETRDEVKRAHRAAMKRWHPDQGGSVDLAARANEAKEVLLRRHARNS